MKKIMKPGNKYFIINTDEPYAKAIYEVLKAGQIAKGEWPEGDISFEEWIKRTFNQLCRSCCHSRHLNDPVVGDVLICRLKKAKEFIVDEEDTCCYWGERCSS